MIGDLDINLTQTWLSGEGFLHPVITKLHINLPIFPNAAFWTMASATSIENFPTQRNQDQVLKYKLDNTRWY